jgi:hypothetical protein
VSAPIILPGGCKKPRRSGCVTTCWPSSSCSCREL